RRLRLDGLPQRVIELLQDRGVVEPLMRLAASLDVEAIWITLEDSFRAVHRVNAAVRARQVRAVLHDDGAAERGLDQAGVDVAEGKAFAPLGRILREVLARPV